VNEFSAADLSVIIPTRNRWPILAKTLAALRDQTVKGFDVLVVVDGTDQQVPDLGCRMLCQEHGGPGAARNTGAAAISTPLVLFLGDDMVPSRPFIDAHLRGHNRNTALGAGVLGHVVWHPDVAASRIHRWLDWSATQFNYQGLSAGDDAHWTRFYSCNVSLKREFFIEAGVFDADFVYYYEDLDCGFRLGERGLHLRYEPEALAYHQHSYDWARIVHRFDGVALGERMMAAKHSWFSPFFVGRAKAALTRRRASPVWPLIVDRVPTSRRRIRAIAEKRANRWYYRRLAPRYLAAYEAAGELTELQEYLGDRFDQRKLWNYQDEVEREEAAAPDERTFYRTSEAYLYDLTVFALSCTKLPYHSDLEQLVAPGARLLDYGCGIGSDGLRLIGHGYQVEFADFDNPSTRYLRWRLKRRDIKATVHNVEREVPSEFDVVYCFDVVEHVDDPFEFLAKLEQLARLVVVNFVGPAPGDTHLHKPLDVSALLDYVERRELVHYRLYHGRSHLVAYRGSPATSPAGSRLERRLGPLRGKLEARVSALYP